MSISKGNPEGPLVRGIDDIGRITIPKKMRIAAGIYDDMNINITLQEDGSICITKFVEGAKADVK